MKKVIYGIFAFAFIFCTSCQDKAAQEELEKMKAQVQLEEKNKVVSHMWHNELFLEDKWDELADEILDPDIVLHLPGMEEVKGIEETIKLGEIWATVSNIKVNHFETIAEGEYVLIRWDVSFDHTGEFMGIPATNKNIQGIYGMDLFLFKEGKIKEFWQNFDQLQMLQQLGMELHMKESTE